MSAALSIPPHLSRRDGFEPLELFSPSGLQLASDCERAYGYRYLYGWRTPDMDWDAVVAAALRGQKVGAGDRSRALGKALHKTAEDYFAGREIDWATEPASRFLPGVLLLPDPRTCAVEAEHKVAFDSARILALPEPIVWNERCSKDFVVEPQDSAVLSAIGFKVPGLSYRSGMPLLGDHKTTKDFSFTTMTGEVVHGQKSAETLAEDTQLNLYVVDVALRYDVSRVACRWVYYRTDPRQRPAARPTDLVREFEPAAKVVEGLIIQAAGLRQTIRDFRAGTVDVSDLKPNPAHCGRFGGCPYHASQGGPCTAAWDFTKTVSGGPKNMANWREKLAERNAQTAAPAASAPPPPPEQAPAPPPPVASAPAPAAAPAVDAEVVPSTQGPKRARAAQAPAAAVVAPSFSFPSSLTVRIEIAIAEDTLEAMAMFLGFTKA